MQILFLILFLIISSISSYSSKLSLQPQLNRFTTTTSFEFSDDGYIKLYSIQILKEPSSQTNTNTLNIQLLLNKQFVSIPIDISSDKIWYQPTYLYNTNNIYLNKTVPPLSELSLIQGTLDISLHIGFTDVIFFLYNNTINPTEYKTSGFGLSRKYENKEHSFIEKLNEQKLKRMFSLGIDKNDLSKGYLKIGDSYRHTRQKNHRTISAKLVDFNKLWAIHIESVFISNNNLTVDTIQQSFRIINETTVLDSVEEFIIVNDNFIQYLYNELFKSYIQNKQCILNKEGKYNIKKYFCKETSLQDFPNIYFIINNKHLVLNASNLFIKQEDSNEYNMMFVFMNNNLKLNTNQQIIFGNIILNFLDEIVFDYDSEKILLILPNEIMYFNSSTSHFLNAKHYSSDSKSNTYIIISLSKMLFMLIMINTFILLVNYCAVNKKH